jgi:protein SCO1/2
MTIATAFLVSALAAAPAPPPPPPRNPSAGLLRAVRFDQNLDARVPLDLPFRDESGTAVRLGDLFRGRPVILTLVYFECPMLCTVELNALVRSLRPLALDVGRQFDIITVSINPAETPALAARKKAGYLARYGRAGAEPGWHFLTGDQASIAALTRAAGFHYAYDPASGQYAHPAGIVILTPGGKIARYFYGVDFPARDLRLGLIEASAGTIGSPVDHLLLYCFHYDPATGKYNVVVMGALRVFGLATVAALGTFLLVLFRRDARRR